MKFLFSFLNLIRNPYNRNKKFLFLLRLLWWKLNRKFFRLPVVVPLFKDIKFICYPQSSFGSLIVYTNYPEYSETRLVQKLLRKNSVFIDVGANIGYYSLLAASIIKKGKIFAFEVDKRALNNFYENINLNKLEDKIDVVEKLVSDKDGYERFIVSSESEVNRIVGKSGSGKDFLKFPCIKLDSFAKEKNISFIDFLKIDVEGAEYKVLNGAGELLKEKRIKYLLFEVNKNIKDYGKSKKYVFDMLNKFGYRIYKFVDGKNNFIEKLENSDLLSDETRNYFASLKSLNIKGLNKIFNEYK